LSEYGEVGALTQVASGPALYADPAPGIWYSAEDSLRRRHVIEFFPRSNGVQFVAAGNSVFTTPIGSRAAYRLPDGTTLLIIMTVEGLPLDGPPAVGGEPLRAAFRAVVVDAEGRPIGAMTLPG